MSSVLEQMHEIEPHVRIGRARAGVLMLILSDAIALVLSGLAYYGWERSVRKNGGVGLQPFFLLSLIIMVVALVGQTLVSVKVNQGYASPFDAYESVITLITWFTAVHLFLTTIVGLLFLGRIMRGRVRVAGQNYLAEVVGYWWYYTVISAILLWLFSLVI